MPRRDGAPAAARGAVALAALLMLTLALAPRADAGVYWPNQSAMAIGRATDDGAALNLAFVGNVSVPCGVASDGAHVYWIDRADRSIGRANVDGTAVNRRFITGVDGCALAVDAAHVYWTDVSGSIGRANLDGTGVTSGFIASVGAVFGVAVDRGHVYWSTFSSIGRANLDGTEATRNFISVNPWVDQPCGVAEDAGHLYWANGLGTIGRANLDGTGREESFIRAAPSGSLVCGVAVDSAHLYWAHFALDAPDTVIDGIGRANLDGTRADQTFIAASDAMSVAVDATAQAALPSHILIGDVKKAEGDAGQSAFQFTITLDSPQSSPVTVDFATADDSATAPSDYASTTDTVTFDPGETAKTTTVRINGDTTVEPDETFNINLTNATGNATIADGRGVATIVNDDPLATPPRCAGTNSSDVQISDFSTVESPISLSGCTGNASATATVEVHIVHTFIGDMIVTLVAPDGSSHVLHNRAGGSTHDINQTYTVNLSSVQRNGTWRLRVQDAAFGDIGRIDSWTVSL
jgi:hypothetical protein